MDTGRGIESGSPKNNLAKNRKKRKTRSGMETWTEARHVVKDRTNWRMNTAALWAMGPEKDR